MTKRAPLILVLDDDPNILEPTADLLRQHGFEVVTAADGSEGLELVFQRLPDLMLVDLAMPGIDGLEFARRVGRMAATSKIPVVAYTAHAFGSSSDDARAAGFDAVISKPTRADQLVRVVQKCLAL
ncbi:MAG: response regulator [Deltaproteobacteria bacterium]|nr:response regulator [Deltaproteobacteria bacterium]